MLAWSIVKIVESGRLFCGLWYFAIALLATSYAADHPVAKKQNEVY